MNARTVLVCTVAVVLAFTTSWASADAAVVMSDGFEGYAAGISPNPLGDLDPGGTWTLYEGWPGTNDFPTNIQVWTGSSPSAHSGDNYLHVSRPSGVAGNNTASWAGHTAPASDEVLIDDVWLRNETDADAVVVVSGEDVGGFSFYAVADVRLEQDGKVYAYNTPAWTKSDTGLTYSLDTWVRLTMEMDMDAETYTIQINGGTKSAAYDFIDTTRMPNGFGLLTIAGSSYSADDMTTTIVPEPSTLAMLVMGAIGAVTFWRRRSR